MRSKTETTADQAQLLHDTLYERYGLVLNLAESVSFLRELCVVMGWDCRQQAHLLAGLVRLAQRVSGKGNFLSAHDLRAAVEVLIIRGAK